MKTGQRVILGLTVLALLAGFYAYGAGPSQTTQLKLTPRPKLAATAGYAFVLSSGLFSIPENAKVVDWAVVNDSGARQTIRVTVYKCGIGVAKAVVAPGALELTLEPGFTTHNSNAVDSVFVRGFYYEVVVETHDKRVLPCVQIWQDSGNTFIPGTLIPAGDFVDIK